MDEIRFMKMTADEYRKFICWIEDNGQEMYENKVAYETRWEADIYYVRLCDESMCTLDDIVLDIEEGIGYNTLS